MFIYLHLLYSLILFQAEGSAPASSPPASTELICHTVHPSDCYPAIFQPTEHFQRIHDDQSIPPGLHVRMNLATGLKEARLNVPEPPETPHADLVIIDDPPPRPNIQKDPSVPELLELHDESHSETTYERGPYQPAAFDVEESSLFSISIATLHSATILSAADLPALSILQDLAHSIHWGVALTRDAVVSQQLVSAIFSGYPASNEVRSAAMLLLGTAIHSNPDALSALLGHSYLSEADMSPVLNVLAVLRQPEQDDMTLKTRTVFLLSQLCQNTEQLGIFVRSEGLLTLSDLFRVEQMPLNDENHKFRAKAANFLHDRILCSLGGLDRLKYSQALIKGLEPWCDTLTTALRDYKFVGTREKAMSPVADAAYKSIEEANQKLREEDVQLGICGSEFEL